MKEIEDTTVVGGLVDLNGDLILQTREGTQLEAGHVKGDKGDPGIDGEDGVSPVLEPATTAVAGVAKLATSAQVKTGASSTTIVTPSGLAATKMKGTVSPLWTTGNPRVTLTDNTVVTATYGNRQHRLRPGDQVLCEIISDVWHIIEVVKANGPEWTNFIPLPIANNYLRPWYQDSGWSLRGDDAYHRDHDPHTAIWLTKNSSGVVSMQGLAGSGSGIPASTVFANLPVGFRPSTIRLFPATVNDTRVHVEIHPDGRMLFPNFAVPPNAWVTLSNAIFHDAAQDLNWIAPTTWYNGFTPHSSNAAYPIGYAVDSFGWTWFRGIVKPGGHADMNAMFEVPKAMMPDRTYHLPCATSSNTAFLSVRHNQAVGYLDYRVLGTVPGAWISADGIFYPPASLAPSLFPGYGAGNSIGDPLGQLTWYNSWVNYDPVLYPSMGFTKRPDGLVWWQGLVKAGVIGQPMVYIPRTYRPLIRTAFERVAHVAHARLSFDPEYKFVIPDVGGNAWFGTEGCAYQAAR